MFRSRARACRRAPGPGPKPRQRGCGLLPGRELLDNVGPWLLGLRAWQAVCWGSSLLQLGSDALGLPDKVADPALPVIAWEMVLCTSVGLKLVPSQWCRTFRPPANASVLCCGEMLVTVGLLFTSTVWLRLRSRSTSSYPNHLPTSLHQHSVPWYLIPPAP